MNAASRHLPLDRAIAVDDRELVISLHKQTLGMGCPCRSEKNCTERRDKYRPQWVLSSHVSLSD
jgi:hypothetical protein